MIGSEGKKGEAYLPGNSFLWNYRKQTLKGEEWLNNNTLPGTIKSVVGHKERNTNILAALPTGYLVEKKLRQGFKILPNHWGLWLEALIKWGIKMSYGWV